MTELEDFLIENINRFCSKNRTRKDLVDFYEALSDNGIIFINPLQKDSFNIKLSGGVPHITFTMNMLCRVYSDELKNSVVVFSNNLALKPPTTTMLFDFHGARTQNLEVGRCVVRGLKVVGAVQSILGSLNHPHVFEDCELRVPNNVEGAVFKNCRVESTTYKGDFKKCSFVKCVYVLNEHHNESRTTFDECSFVGGRILRNKNIELCHVIFKNGVYKDFLFLIRSGSKKKSNVTNIFIKKLENVEFDSEVENESINLEHPKSGKIILKDCRAYGFKVFQFDEETLITGDKTDFDCPISAKESVVDTLVNIDIDIPKEKIISMFENSHIRFPIESKTVPLTKYNKVDSPFAIAHIENDELIDFEVLNSKSIKTLDPMIDHFRKIKLSWPVFRLLFADIEIAQERYNSFRYKEQDFE